MRKKKEERRQKKEERRKKRGPLPTNHRYRHISQPFTIDPCPEGRARARARARAWPTATYHPAQGHGLSRLDPVVGIRVVPTQLHHPGEAKVCHFDIQAPPNQHVPCRLRSTRRSEERGTAATVALRPSPGQREGEKERKRERERKGEIEKERKREGEKGREVKRS